jgi:hypothetical protein
METSSPGKRSGVPFIILDTTTAIYKPSGARIDLKVVITFKVRKEVHRTPGASHGQTRDTRLTVSVTTVVQYYLP